MRPGSISKAGPSEPCVGQPADWWARRDSNPRQHRYERRVLTAELRAPDEWGSGTVPTHLASSPDLILVSTLSPKLDARVKPGHDGNEREEPYVSRKLRSFRDRLVR